MGPPADLSRVAQVLLAQANSLLSLSVEKSDGVLAAERQLGSEVLTSLLGGLRPADARGQLAAFGFDGAATILAVAVSPPRAADVDLAELCSLLLERRAVAHLVTTRGTETIVVLRPTDANSVWTARSMRSSPRSWRHCA